MSYNKREFYIQTPEGDSILAEIFNERESVTIILAGERRIDLDPESAYELADLLLLAANESGYK